MEHTYRLNRLKYFFPKRMSAFLGREQSQVIEGVFEHHWTLQRGWSPSLGSRMLSLKAAVAMSREEKRREERTRWSCVV